MCDFSGKLIAWLDGELPADEAAGMERHLAGCRECRSSVDAYKRVSGEVDAYCEAEFASSTPKREGPRWLPATLGAGAVAALVVVFLAMPRTHYVAPHAVHAPQAVVSASPVIVAMAAPDSASPVHRVHRRAAATPAAVRETNAAPEQNRNSYSLSDETMIQIAIPADEMFPPGAVPEGMHFVADLTIAPDGSAERLRLQPRLVGFERRTQP
jgi:anti-sigma factor RsiW